MNRKTQTQVDLDLKEQKEFWEAMLSRMARASGLKPDYERNYGEPPLGGEFRIELTGDLYLRLRKLSKGGSFLLYTTLMAGLNVCLYKHTGNPTVLVCSPTRKRPDVAVLQTALLPIVNEVPDRQSFQDQLVSVRQTLRDVYARQHYPLEQLVGEKGLENVLSQRPLVNLVLSLKDIHNDPDDLWDAVSFTFNEEADRITGRVRFNRRLFRIDTIIRFTDHYVRALTEATAHLVAPVGDLSVMSEAEQFLLTVDWNDTCSELRPDLLVHGLIEGQARRAPDSIAVVFEDASLSYNELNRRANQLARRLRRRKIGPDATVAISLARSPELVVAILGVMKSGGAYVPLDQDWPTDRLKVVLEDSGASILLTDQQSAVDAPEHPVDVVSLRRDWAAIAREGDEDPPHIANPQNLAYIMYTSGSTGRPKGVMISHNALVNYLSWCTESYQVSGGRGAPVHSAIAFDLTITSLLSPLICGLAVTLAPDDQGVEGLALCLDRLEDFSLVKITPSHLALLGQQLAPETVAASTRAIVIGGEALSGEALLALRACAPDLRLINEYGPTETVVGCCVYEIPAGAPGSGPVPIGRPIANAQAHVLNSAWRPVPIAESGELCIGGQGLGWGYLNLPGLTADKFIPNPFGQEAGSRLYRTGDVARRLADGNLEFHGRFDNQVKMRGYRIELGELEAVLGKHPAVREAAVLLREDKAKQGRIVAYWVASTTPPPADGELRRFLSERLPQWMIPSAFVSLSAFPLNSNGKIDRAALSELEEAPQESDEIVLNPVEEILVSIWSDVLGVKGLGVNSNFFELGGHSLLVAQVISRVREAFGVAISMLTLFETPTPAGLAELIQRDIRAGLKLPPIEIKPVSRDADLPLSFAQQRLWFLAQLAPESAAYNVPLGLRLTGALNLIALEQTLNEVVRRHEVLRTSFQATDGQAVQIIQPNRNLTLRIVEFAGLSDEEQVAATARLAERESVRPIRLDDWPLIRVRLLRLSEQSHVALLTMHHIVSDGWSTQLLVTEVSSLYRVFSQGDASPLQELEIQYADYAMWQRQCLQGETLANLVSYWKEQLAGRVSMLRLPTDHPRPQDLRFRGAGESLQLSKETAERLKTLSRSQGMTLFMTLLAAFKVLLLRYSGQDDIVVGSATANRNNKQTEKLMGFFVNMLVLRTNLSGNPTFREALNRVRQVALGAFSQQDLPFEKVVAELQPERHLSHTPFLQVVFVLQNTPQATLRLPGLSLSPFGVGFGMTHFDLYMSMAENAQGLRATLEYNADLFESHTITRMLDIFGRLLERLSARPDERVLEVPLGDGEGTSFTHASPKPQATLEREQFVF